MTWQVIKSKAGSIYHSLHTWINPILCLLVFILEFGVIFLLLGDLFTGKNWFSWIYSRGVAIAVGGYEIKLIYDIKKRWNTTKELDGGRIAAYIFTLLVFFMSALAYNLRTFYENESAVDINSNYSDSIKTEINDNKAAIQKYNLIFQTTNNMQVAMYYRSMANDLVSSNKLLLIEIKSITNIGENHEVDSFQLLHRVIPINIQWLKFTFLSTIWAVLAYILFMSMPAGKVEEINKKGKLSTDNETNTQWLKENAENVKKFISVMYRKEGKSDSVKSTDSISEEIGISQEDADKIRDMFCYYIYIANGKNKKYILTPQHGRTIANIQKSELLNLFDNYLKGIE